MADNQDSPEKAARRKAYNARRDKDARREAWTQKHHPVAGIPDDAMPSVGNNAPSAGLPERPMNMHLEALTNAPRSLYRNTIEPFTKPWELSKNMSNIMIGAGANVLGIENKYNDMADKAWEEIKRPYTSMENFNETYRKDPFRIVGDVAGAMTGAGGAARVAATPVRATASAAEKVAGMGNGLPNPNNLLTKYADTVRTGADVLGDAGKSVMQAGMAGDPMSIAANASKVPSYLIKPPVKKLDDAVKSFQSGAKFSTTMPIKDRTAAAKAAVFNKIDLSPDGVNKLNGLIDERVAPILDSLNEAGNAGVRILPNEIFSRLAELDKRYATPQLNGERNRATLASLRKSFEDELINSPSLTPMEVHRIKTNAYDQIKWDDKKAASGTTSYVTNQFEKAIAGGAKDALDKAIPSIKESNADLGNLLKLRDPLERAVNRIGNREGTPFMSAADAGGSAIGGGFIGGTAATGANLALPLLDPVTAGALGTMAGGSAGYMAMLAKKYGEHPLIRSQRAGRNVENINFSLSELMKKPRPKIFGASQASSIMSDDEIRNKYN